MVVFVEFNEDGRCELNKLFNLDLCECWDEHTVDPITCLTKPGYDVKQLLKALFMEYNTTITEGNYIPF